MGYLEDNNIDYPENDTFIPYATETYSRDLTLLEIGAGLHSTRVFSQYFTKMYSIENNSRFENIYHDNYIHIDLDPKTGWYNKKDFESRIPKDYDLIFLDGPAGYCGFTGMISSEKRPFRLGFCEISWDVIKKDVPIIVDDIWRDWRERDVVKFLKDKGYECTDYEKFSVCEPK